MSLKRYVFEIRVVEKIDAYDEEDARERLENPEEWVLIDVTDIPLNQMTKQYTDEELNG
jgi:ribosomal silencing factor RsfS